MWAYNRQIQTYPMFFLDGVLHFCPLGERIWCFLTSNMDSVSNFNVRVSNRRSSSNCKDVHVSFVLVVAGLWKLSYEFQGCWGSGGLEELRETCTIHYHYSGTFRSHGAELWSKWTPAKTFVYLYDVTFLVGFDMYVSSNKLSKIS